MGRLASGAFTAVLTGIVLCGVAAGTAYAQEAVAEPDPAAYHRRVMANGRLRTSGTGEGFCWHAASAADDFLDAYEAFKNPKWLEMAETYYDWCLTKLQKDPDGYEGWIGTPIDGGTSAQGIDAVVGDAILCKPLVRFAEIVLKKEPQLKARFGKTAERYVHMATRICWEKWNRRGCYYRDAAGWGSYSTYPRLIDLKAGTWIDAPSRHISNNLNKHYSMSMVLLRLWRITGKPEYRERCLEVFGRAKVMWRHYPDDDRVVWNFWMPHAPYDLEGRAPKSWVAVHPGRAGYQAGEVRNWVEVYDSGLVFDRADLERIIRTNHWMMPAEGRAKWRSADGTTEAGTLWSALARFDGKIRSMYEAQLRAGDTPTNRIRLAYLQRVVLKGDPWARRGAADASKVEVAKAPLQPGRNIQMSVVIPDTVETAADSRIQCACKTAAAGTLKIELLDESGRRTLGTLAEVEVGERQEFHAPFWDGTNPATGARKVGQYQIRWSLAGESRTAPVWVKRGTKRRDGGPEPMRPGQTLTADFEKPLDARWQLEAAEPSTEKAHGGRMSLKVERTARLVFGRYDDLPVRITMWIHDAGATFGTGTADGPGWGVVTGVGDKFAVRQMWRTYLAGDRGYAWLNTGENQWFSPHPSGVNRKTGWSQWVFDFTGPSTVKVSGNGQAVTRLTPKFTPKGAVAVFLMGSRQGGPLYVDDVKVEYPKK